MLTRRELLLMLGAVAVTVLLAVLVLYLVAAEPPLPTDSAFR